MAQYAQNVLSAFEVQALISYLDQEPVPMMVMNTEYEILAANTAYQRQFGTVGRSYVGHKCYAVSHHYTVPCDQAGEHCPLQNALASKGPDRVLHIHHTPRGPEHVDVELRPIIDAEHKVVGFVERLLTVRNASAQPSSEGLVGQAPAFNRALAELQRVAPSSLPVLLLGESGTGKELFARAVHEASARARGPFVVVDCSGLTETLFESELFGYEKGAFTGAVARKAGLVETAKGGTLFLDEIGELPLALQAKFLHFLEDGSYRPIGSGRALDADVRVVAATNRDLAQEVRLGRFREDLYYRLNVIQLRIPPLRERGADIVELAQHFARRYARDEHCSPIRFADETGQMLLAYPWPGNVRELKNLVERLTILMPGRLIVPSDLPHEITAAAPALAPPARFAVEADGAGTRPIEHQLAAAERKLLEDALSRAGGQKGRAAEILGISRHALKRRLQRLGL